MYHHSFRWVVSVSSFATEFWLLSSHVAIFLTTASQLRAVTITRSCVALTIVDTDDANCFYCDGFTFISMDAVVAVHKSIDSLLQLIRSSSKQSCWSKLSNSLLNNNRPIIEVLSQVSQFISLTFFRSLISHIIKVRIVKFSKWESIIKYSSGKLIYMKISFFRKIIFLQNSFFRQTFF